MEFFNLPDGDNRRPHQVALDWLIEQNLKPGDRVSISDIDQALCLADPGLAVIGGRRMLQDWTLARFAEFVRLREGYENETGHTLVETGRAYLVCERETAAELVGTDTASTMVRRCWDMVEDFLSRKLIGRLH